jgi:hypothetical protein
MVKASGAKARKPGRPPGSTSSYRKVRRRNGAIAAQPNFSVRFANEAERAFVEEAATSAKESLSQFGATASLDRAEKILSRPRPALPA